MAPSVDDVRGGFVVNPFDDLPKRGRNHEVEEFAIAAFRQRLAESGAFILQSVDEKDYGIDCQIEVVDHDSATNARLQVQLKGTERDLNVDGSVSIEVDRTNLNYLMMQDYGLYVCYHAPSGSLRVCLADAVLRRYDHGGTDWTRQSTLTVAFREELTVKRLASLAGLVRSGTATSRDRRIKQVTANPSTVPAMLRRAVPKVHVPAERVEAAKLLQNLYEGDANDVISSAFDEFAAVLGADDDAMGPCYMAEVNRGLDRRGMIRSRVEKAIDHFQCKIPGGKFQPGSLQYNIGNAHSALGDETAARSAYEAALQDQAFMKPPSMAAQVFKNLGSSIERLGDAEGAVSHYREALRLDPHLPEAHAALGNYFVRIGDYEAALDHFDRAIFLDSQLGRVAAVGGWKVNALFNLNDGRAAFREINALLVRAESEPWIWPWCAKQVGNFGRASPENALNALLFWRRYVGTYPDHVVARREYMLVAFYARRHGLNIETNYVDFRIEFDRHIGRFDSEDAAFLWDRLGHWAQEEGKWEDAASCYRQAYDLDGGEYGYCLAMALNRLGRGEECLPIALEQAETFQPDALSWFQVAVAYELVGSPEEAIATYGKVIRLNPEDEDAWFNLGGIFWNAGMLDDAAEVWNEAIERFPGTEQALKAQSKMAISMP